MATSFGSDNRTKYQPSNQGNAATKKGGPKAAPVNVTGFCRPVGSEGELAHDLKDAGIGCSRGKSSVGRCRRLHGVQDGSERALAQVGDRIGEVRMIEDVVSVGPQGEGEPFVQTER